KAALEDAQGYGFFDNFETAEMRAARQESAEAVASTASGNASARRETRRETERSAISHTESTSIRVGIEKVDQLINLVGELVITQAMIEQRSSTLDPMVHERLLASVSQLNRNTRDLQEAVMSIRM